MHVLIPLRWIFRVCTPVSGLAIVATVVAPLSKAQTYGLGEVGKAALSRQLRSAVDRGDTPGAVALVVGRDGVLYEQSAGELDTADRRPMPLNAIFRIASMTKPVTSVAIMMLFEERKLKLDDPVSKYLAGFTDLRVISYVNQRDGTYETRPAKRPITIRHLLTHTSGIGYGFSDPIEHLLTEAAKKPEWELPLLSDPGEKWIYGANTILLGQIIEKLTGESLEAYFQKRIFQPLGMTDTSYAVPVAKQTRVPALYRRIDRALRQQPRTPIPSTPTAPFLGDRGLYSTAQDYGKFIQMLLNGGHLGPTRILKESSVQMMAENNIGPLFVRLQPDADKLLTRPFPLRAGHDKFGLGFQITSDDPRYRKFRSPGSLSWGGIFNTEFWIDPAKHIGAVLMMQVLPFYDEGAIRTLCRFEQTLYRNLHQVSNDGSRRCCTAEGNKPDPTRS